MYVVWCDKQSRYVTDPIRSLDVAVAVATMQRSNAPYHTLRVIDCNTNQEVYRTIPMAALEGWR